MEWLIVLILLVGFGGIFYVLPSRQQRRVSRVRLAARKRGLVVTSVSLPNLAASAELKVTAGGRKRHPAILCVSYEKLHLNRSGRSIVWQLLRDPKSEIPLRGWSLRDALPEGVGLTDAEYWKTVEGLLARAPETCLAVQSQNNSVGWIGNELDVEKPDEEIVDQFERWLDDFMTLNTSRLKSKSPEEPKP